MDDKTEKTVKKELKIHARALGIAEGAAEDFIDAAIVNTKTTLRGKTVITEADLRRAVGRALKKFNADLAYVYENCDIMV